MCGTVTLLVGVLFYLASHVDVLNGEINVSSKLDCHEYAGMFFKKIDKHNILTKSFKITLVHLLIG